MVLSLYNEPGVHINDLLRAAHPNGSAHIIDTPSHEGVVEDSIEAQIKTIKMVYKQPIAHVVASLASQLESLGASDLAEAVDKIAFDFYHESVLVKTAGAGATQKVVAATDLLIKILKAYQQGSGRELLIAVNNTRDKFISLSTWEDAQSIIKNFLISTIKNALAELESFKKEMLSDSRHQEMLNDSAVQMNFNREASNILNEVFQDSKDVEELSKYGFENYMKPMEDMMASLRYVISEPFTAVQKFSEDTATPEKPAGEPTNPTTLSQRLEAIKTKITTLQQQADGLVAIGVPEAEVDQVLTQYLSTIASFKKIYTYVASVKGQIPANLTTKVSAVIDQTDKQLAALEEQLGKLGG